MNINFYLVCSDQYQNILEVHAELFNKYWKNQDVNVLCYKYPEFKLPDNFQIISLGQQTKDCAPIINYFSKLNDEPFIFNIEDQILVDYVNIDKIEKLYIEVVEKRADKASLHFYGDHCDETIDGDFVYLKQDADYRTSVHPAIWSKQYFLKYLKPWMNWWQFELTPYSKNDGAKIIYLREQKVPNCLFNTTNLYRKGQYWETGFQLKPSPANNGLVYIEDIEIINKCRV